MSRVGKKPVLIPAAVTVSHNAGNVEVKGPKGNLSRIFPNNVNIAIVDNSVVVTPVDDSKHSLAMWGTTRNLINNMVIGVSVGFTQILDIIGVGFKAATDGKILTISLGYSHEIKYIIPSGIAIKMGKPTEIEISGADKEEVGKVSADIIKLRKHDPYKGKGIRKRGAYVLRKEGKKK